MPDPEENQDDMGQGQDGGDQAPEQPQGWRVVRDNQKQVFIETGRSKAVPVPVGSPFIETIERIARASNYGDSCRVFLNSVEILNPEEMAGKTIEAGMRIVLTTYDKPGV